MAREESILLNNLAKRGGNWSTKIILFIWEIDTNQKFLTLLQAWKDKLSDALAGIPPKADQMFKKKWFCLLGSLRSAVP